MFSGDRYEGAKLKECTADKGAIHDHDAIA